MLKSEFPKSVHALHSGLFLSFAFHTNTGGDTQSVKERKSKVDWCNPLYSGTKGSNWNENMSTSKHMHWKTHAHNEHSALFMHIKLRNKAPVCLCVLYVRSNTNVPLGLFSRQLSKLPGNGAGENCPQREPETTNQCQWTCLSLSLCIKPAYDDVMTAACLP